MRIFATLILMLLLTGCKSAPKHADTEPFEYRFEKTKEKESVQKQDKRNATVRFDGVPFSQAMSILTQETNAPIVWSQTLDLTTASGTFGAFLRCGSLFYPGQ
ncbi:MAG: hypothetical protein LBN39_06790 [Planctomycetaceae bacterium]|jgi:hypothetical protein|nr:hypothetical protein [Planctomycetaceae bacterium]